jgi:hypothetical protein
MMRQGRVFICNPQAPTFQPFQVSSSTSCKLFRTYLYIGSADLQVGCPVGLQSHRRRPLAAWTPPVQPVFHPKKQRPFLGDLGLETGATLLFSIYE